MGDPLGTVEARLAAMPLERRHQLLRRAGVDPASISAAEAVPGPGAAHEGSRWGFPTNLPPRHRLIEYVQRQQAASAAEAPPPPPQQQGQAGQPAQQQQQQQRPLLLELLEQSRTFQSPDCAEAMAELFGAADLHRSLRGSLLADVAPEQAVGEARTALRGALNSAWSQEALRGGVALAKAGDLQAAMPCYDQALQMDPSNADALVARGAALANRQQWQHASDDLEAALELQSQHSNAQQYLEAVQSKAAQSGVALLPLAASRAAAAAAAAAANGAQASPPGEQRQEQRQEQRERGEAAEGRPAAAAGQRHEREERRRGRHESVERRKRGRDSSRSRSRSRSRGRRRRRRGGSRERSGSSRSGSSRSDGSSGGSDSEAEATAAQLAAAAAAGGEGNGMDVATALQIVSSHYKSRHGKREGGKTKKRKKEKRKHGKRHGKRRKG